MEIASTHHVTRKSASYRPEEFILKDYRPKEFSFKDATSSKGYTVASVVIAVNQLVQEAFSASQKGLLSIHNLTHPLKGRCDDGCEEVKRLLRTRGLTVECVNSLVMSHTLGISWEANNAFLRPAPTLEGPSVSAILKSDRARRYDLVASGQISDCKITFSDGKSVNCLRAELIAGSGQLGKMLSNNMVEGLKKEINLPTQPLTTELNLMLAILMGRYNRKEIEKELNELSYDSMICLLESAVYFAAPSIIAMCVNSLFENTELWHDMSLTELVTIALLSEKIDKEKGVFDGSFEREEMNRVSLKPRIKHFFATHPSINESEEEIAGLSENVSDYWRVLNVALQYTQEDLASAVASHIEGMFTNDKFTASDYLSFLDSAAKIPSEDIKKQLITALFGHIKRILCRDNFAEICTYVDKLPKEPRSDFETSMKDFLMKDGNKEFFKAQYRLSKTKPNNEPPVRFDAKAVAAWKAWKQFTVEYR